MVTLFLVEDDPTIASVMKREFEKWEYDVHIAEDFQHIVDEFVRVSPQLVFMDISLPAYNGYYWCQEIRKQSQVPIIFISSRSDNMDIVMAMQMGGDDFISKPFDLTVAVAKTQALLRRTYDFQTPSLQLSFHGLILKLAEAKLVTPTTEIDLTRTELQILHQLFIHKEQFISRDALMLKLWEDESFIDDNTLAVNIARLRKKLSGAGITELILTKKNVGYALKGEFRYDHEMD